jgi:hypothetical protein
MQEIPEEMQAGARSLLAASIALIKSEEWTEMVEQSAIVCANYYKKLIEHGVPEDAAGTITAAYAQAVSKVGEG